MKVIGKDRTSCDVCNPIDEILARLDALERRASAIVAKVQGIAPDGEGNVTLPTSSSDTDPLHGRVDTFAMSSEVKEAADDAHAYAASIADDVVVLQSDVEILTREVEALDPASVAALEQSVAALQQTVNQLSNLVGGFSAVIRDLEDQMPNKVDRTGDTMTGPLNVIDTVTGSRNTQAVNGNRLQNDLDNYEPMVRDTGNKHISGIKEFEAFSAVCAKGNVTPTESSKFVKIATISTQMIAQIRITIGGGYTSTCNIIDILLNAFEINAHYFTARKKSFNTGFIIKVYTAYSSGSPGIDVWIELPNNEPTWIYVEGVVTRYNERNSNQIISVGNLEVQSDPSSSYTNFDEVIE